MYEGTFNGSRVRIRRVKTYPGGDPQKIKEVCLVLHFSVLGNPQILQVFRQVAVTSKHLSHANIVPILGATIEPYELISDWMPGGDLPGYIANNPDADRLSLVGFFVLHPLMS